MILKVWNDFHAHIKTKMKMVKSEMQNIILKNFAKKVNTTINEVSTIVNLCEACFSLSEKILANYTDLSRQLRICYTGTLGASG